MPSILLAPFTPNNRSATLARLLALYGVPDAVESKGPEGKPFLQMPDGGRRGLAITHVRKAKTPLSLMAIAGEPMFAIDAEAWPSAVSDETFLKAISSLEDVAVIARLKASGRDAGTALWAIKEAALKASGEVMNEPRNISVEPSPNGHYWAATSASATAPVPTAKVGLWRFKMMNSSQSGLLAVAFAGVLSGKFGPTAEIRVNAPDFALEIVS
jgi:hypothetical protein